MPSGSPDGALSLPAAGLPVAGVFVLLPGLNLHPDRLSPWNLLLRERGYAVHAPALAGICPPAEPDWRSVRAARWLEDLDRARAELQQRLPGVPLCLAGYSLGAVLGLCWAWSRGVALERALLLSPALRLRPHLRLVLGLLTPVLPGSWCVPSRAPAAYRLHDRTSVAAYRALAMLQGRFRRELAGRSGPPAVLPPAFVAYAQGDELIDTAYLETLGRQNPGRWRLHRLAHRPRPGYVAHLGLDAFSLGEAEWQRLRDAVVAWLEASGDAPG